MNEWEERINAVLNDPQQLQSITRLAQRFMGQEEDASDSGELPGFDPGMLSRLSQLMGRGDDKSRDKTALLRAMEPYLAPERRERMEKAIRFARMAKIAGAAWQEYGGKGHV